MTNSRELWMMGMTWLFLLFGFATAAYLNARTRMLYTAWTVLTVLLACMAFVGFISEVGRLKWYMAAASLDIAVAVLVRPPLPSAPPLRRAALIARAAPTGGAWGAPPLTSVSAGGGPKQNAGQAATRESAREIRSHWRRRKPREPRGAQPRIDHSQPSTAVRARVSVPRLVAYLARNR
jgi:hypothetical protein